MRKRGVIYSVAMNKRSMGVSQQDVIRVYEFVRHDVLPQLHSYLILTCGSTANSEKHHSSRNSRMGVKPHTRGARHGDLFARRRQAPAFLIPREHDD